MSPTRALTGMLILIACCGCLPERQRYDGTGQVETPPSTNPTRDRIVLFAPTAVGPLAEIYPAARLDFPYAMADRVDLLMTGFDGRVGEILPVSDAKRWQEGHVAATAGVHAVVLTEVVTVTLVKGMLGFGNRPDHVEAVVELRVLDVKGNLIYRKRAAGEADALTSPKVLSSDGRVESRAAWAAMDTALAGFRTFLNARNELAEQPVQMVEAKVSVTIASDPAQADVLINGDFKGTTPLTLTLPNRELTVKIERQGFVPWQRVLVPSADMPIHPVLIPLPPAARAAPSAE